MILRSENYRMVQFIENTLYNSLSVWYGDNKVDSLENALFYVRSNFDIDRFETAIFDKFGNYYPIKK